MDCEDNQLVAHVLTCFYSVHFHRQEEAYDFMSAVLPHSPGRRLQPAYLSSESSDEHDQIKSGDISKFNEHVNMDVEELQSEQSHCAGTGDWGL